MATLSPQMLRNQAVNQLENLMEKHGVPPEKRRNFKQEFRFILSYPDRTRREKELARLKKEITESPHKMGGGIDTHKRTRKRTRCSRGSRRSKSGKTCRKTKRKCSRGSRRSKSGKTCRHHRKSGKSRKSRKSRKTRSAAKRRRSLRGAKKSLRRAKKRRCRSGSRRSKSYCRKYKNHKHKHTTEHKHKHSRFSTIKKRHQKGGNIELEKLKTAMRDAQKLYDEASKMNQSIVQNKRRAANALRALEAAKKAYEDASQDPLLEQKTRRKEKKQKSEENKSHNTSDKKPNVERAQYVGPLKKHEEPRLTAVSTYGKRGGACKKQTTKKYLERASPAYPANDPDCQGKIKTRDGVKYKSVPNKNGVYRWVKM